MGTYYTVQFWSKESVDPGPVDAQIVLLLDQVEDELSNWRAGSWVNQFNQSAPGEARPVPDHAFRVLRLFLALAERSQGMLDPTVGPLVELWGFGVADHQGRPDPGALAHALARVGHQHLILNEEDRTLKKTAAGLEINCSAVAKGYAVDQIGELLHKAGVHDFLINLGGEVLAYGTRRDGHPWKVGITRPDRPTSPAGATFTLDLQNQAMATSGHSQRFFIKDGKRYSHILDPTTGHPVPTELAGVTVVAPSCALADGLATLALILDGNQWTDLLKHFEGVQVFPIPWETEENPG
jgi:thiamine biosynthesis lipoprotein